MGKAGLPLLTPEQKTQVENNIFTLWESRGWIVDKFDWISSAGFYDVWARGYHPERHYHSGIQYTSRDGCGKEVF